MFRNVLMHGKNTDTLLHVVGNEIVTGVEMERNLSRSRLESVRVDVRDGGDQVVMIGAAFCFEAARTEIEDDLGFAGAFGKVGIEHVVDFLEARIGGVAIGIAAAEAGD